MYRSTEFRYGRGLAIYVTVQLPCTEEVCRTYWSGLGLAECIIVHRFGTGGGVTVGSPTFERQPNRISVW